MVGIYAAPITESEILIDHIDVDAGFLLALQTIHLGFDLNKIH